MTGGITTACTRPRISLDVIESLGGFEVECAAGDAGRYAATPDMNKNPLTTTIIVFAIGDGYTLWQAFVTRNVPVFTAIAWLQGIILLVLYLKKSSYAGSYLFYSVIPLFPIYFGLKLAGITAPPTTNVVYFVAFAIYAIAVPLLWKQKYDRYVAAAQSAPAA